MSALSRRLVPYEATLASVLWRYRATAAPHPVASGLWAALARAAHREQPVADVVDLALQRRLRR